MLYIHKIANKYLFIVGLQTKENKVGRDAAEASLAVATAGHLFCLREEAVDCGEGLFEQGRLDLKTFIFIYFHNTFT